MNNKKETFSRVTLIYIQIFILAIVGSLTNRAQADELRLINRNSQDHQKVTVFGKGGPLSLGAEVAYKISHWQKVGLSLDIDSYIVANAAKGVIFHQVNLGSLYAKVEAGYYEVNSDWHAQAGPGAGVTFGNEWQTRSRFAYGFDWIGLGWYQHQKAGAVQIGRTLHWPKFKAGFTF